MCGAMRMDQVRNKEMRRRTDVLVEQSRVC